MNIKRALLLGGAVLIAAVLLAAAWIFFNTKAGENPFAKKLAAKEAWKVIEPVQETLGIYGVPVYIEGNSLPESPIANGKASSWDAGFYSESEKTVTDVRYLVETDGKVTILRKEKFGCSVSFKPCGLEGWNTDSPEAYGTVRDKASSDYGDRGEIRRMRLQAAGLDGLGMVFKVPGLVPDSCKLFWVIFEEDNEMFYYIDASTGEFLGGVNYGDLNALEG